MGNEEIEGKPGPSGRDIVDSPDHAPPKNDESELKRRARFSRKQGLTTRSLKTMALDAKITVHVVMKGIMKGIERASDIVVHSLPAEELCTKPD